MKVHKSARVLGYALSIKSTALNLLGGGLTPGSTYRIHATASCFELFKTVHVHGIGFEIVGKSVSDRNNAVLEKDFCTNGARH